LQLNDLLVHETRPVVDDLHRVRRVANWTRAFCWLGNLATVNIDFDGMIADLASEESVFHVRDNWGGSNDKTFDGNDLVDI
jgi:hypothetical protein